MGKIISLKYDFSFKHLFLNEVVRQHFISDALEIHVVELNMTLSGSDRMDDWIRLFNVKTEEELEMLEAGTNHLGILEAIKEVRIMSLRKHLRMLYEAHLKEVRDRAARKDYVRREGWDAGHSEGRKEGWDAGHSEGEDKLNRLNSSLIADKRFKDLDRAIEDKEYRGQLYKEYGIF